MPSEFKHIDDLVRGKETEVNVDLSLQDKHWQEMKALMGGTRPAARVRSISGKSLFQWIGGLAVAVTAIVVLVVRQQDTSFEKVIAEKTKATLPIALQNKKPAVSEQQVAQQQSAASVKKEIISSQTVSKAETSEGIQSVFIQQPVVTDNNYNQLSEQVQALNGFFQSFQKQHQDYLIDAESDTTLYGKDGTVIFIPAHSFTDASGKRIRGKLNFRLNEFYDYADIIAYKLSTTSDHEMLGTGGMLYLEATQGQDKLVLKKESSIRVNMPTERFDPEMQLFYGDRQEEHALDGPPSDVVVNEPINWTAAGQKQYFFNFENWTITVADFANDPREVVTRRGRKIARFITHHDKKEDIDAIKAELKIRHGYLYDEIRVRNGWRAKKPVATDTLAYTDGLVGSSIRVTLKQARQLKLISAKDSMWHYERWKKQVEKSDSMQRQLLQLKDQYSFSVANLGWVNCDKFLAIQAPRVQFTASTGEAFKNTFFYSFLVFKDMNSMIQGRWDEGKLVFHKMPSGKRATLVCVGMKDGKAFSSVKDTQISSRLLEGLEFKETSPEKFKEEMKRFGNVIRG